MDCALYLEDCEARGGSKEGREMVGAVLMRSGRRIDGY